MSKRIKQSKPKSSLPKRTKKQAYTIDAEFQNLLPAKTPEEYEALKEEIRSDGEVREPLVVWDEENILLDGHHRDRIGKELKITPPIYRKSFASRDEAREWIVRNQLEHRRNLNSFQRIVTALKCKPGFETQAKANQRAAGGAVPSKIKKPVVANEKVAKLAGVSPITVWHVEKILSKADDPDIARAIDALRSGDDTIGGVYNRFFGGLYGYHRKMKKSDQSPSSQDVLVETVEGDSNIESEEESLSSPIQISDKPLGERDEKAFREGIKQIQELLEINSRLQDFFNSIFGRTRFRGNKEKLRELAGLIEEQAREFVEFNDEFQRRCRLEPGKSPMEKRAISDELIGAIAVTTNAIDCSTEQFVSFYDEGGDLKGFRTERKAELKAILEERLHYDKVRTEYCQGLLTALESLESESPDSGS